MSDAAVDSTSLCHKIRFAEEPDNPDLLHRWLSLFETSKQLSSQERWRTLLIQHQLLIATLSDTRLPLSWRCHCLENIYLPLREMAQMAQSERERHETRRLYFETRMVTLCCMPQRH